MNDKRNGPFSTMALTFLLSPIFALATPGEVGATETCSASIPVVVVGESKAVGYPQPICSKCKKVKARTETTSEGETQGVVELVYFDEIYLTFDGTVEVTVLLPDSTWDLITIEDVSLSEHQPVAWSLPAGAGWTWDEIEALWIELRPA
ncbi:MAG: hypothetical protein AAGF11_39855 [Myxococcota bacterium]